MIHKIIRGIILGLLLVSLFNGCAGTPVLKGKPEHPKMGEEIKHYVDLVRKLSGGCLGNLKHAGFFKKEPKHPTKGKTLAGLCTFIVPSFEPEIEINRKTWERLTFHQKVFLVAHECYHCELPGFSGFGHNDERDEVGCYKSLMASTMDTPYCTRKNADNFIKEMRWCE